MNDIDFHTWKDPAWSSEQLAQLQQRIDTKVARQKIIRARRQKILATSCAVLFSVLGVWRWNMHAGARDLAQLRALLESEATRAAPAMFSDRRDRITTLTGDSHDTSLAF